MGSLFNIAARNQGADPGRGDDLSVDGHETDDLGTQACLSGQRFGRPFTIRTESKVRTHRHTLRP
jgi:hypothetical protein